MNARSVVCAANPEMRRSWAVTLEALGASTEQLERIPATLGPVELLVAEADGSPRLGKPTRAILLLPAPHLPTAIGLLADPAVAAVVTADYLDARLLTYAGVRILSGDVFGVAKVLPWGARITSMLVNSHEERLQALSATHGFLRSMGVRGRHLEAIELAVDELLMNAIYNAPASATGPLYASVLPRDRAVLALERPAILQLAGDGRRLVVGVRDSYGSLTRETVVRSIGRCLREGGEVERKASGAGLGLYMVASNATELIINLLPGTATEVISVFALDARGQQLKHLGIYEETFARAAEPAGAAPRPGRPGAAPRRFLLPGLAVSSVVVLLIAALLMLWPYLSRPARGGLRVTASPAGAAIYLNGVRRGTADPVLLIADLDASGSYAVGARKAGHDSVEEVVAIAAGRIQELRLSLRQRRARVYVSSSPPGAEIILSGKPTGQRTPALLDQLEPGRRVAIRLSRHGYTAASTELVPSADETHRFQASLLLAPEFAALALASEPSGARLYVNDVDTGLSTPQAEHVLRGAQAYRLELRAPARVPWEETITPRPGERIERKATLVSGETLSVRANVPGRVSVAGVTRSLPFERVLPAGHYRARLRGDRPYLDHTLPVRITAGSRSEVNLQFALVSTAGHLHLKLGQASVQRAALPAGEHRLSLHDEKTGVTRVVKVRLAAGEDRKLE